VASQGQSVNVEFPLTDPLPHLAEDLKHDRKVAIKVLRP
jgi:hypothetical protein